MLFATTSFRLKLYSYFFKKNKNSIQNDVKNKCFLDVCMRKKESEAGPTYYLSN